MDHLLLIAAFLPLIPLLFEEKYGTDKAVMGALHVVLAEALILVFTPFGGSPLFNVAGLIHSLGPLVFLLLVVTVPIFILVAGASYSSKTGLGGVKEGFHEAFHDVPWSFTGFLFALSSALGVYADPLQGQAMGDTPPMFLGVTVFLICTSVSMSYIVIAWGLWGD